jgi:hypothetical protein
LGKTKNGFEIRNQGFLRTLRFDKKVNIDIKNSKGVAGHNFENNSSYITLDSSGKYELILNNNKYSPYLKDANGWVSSVKNTHNQYDFELKSNVPIEANFHLPKNCKYQVDKTFRTKKTANILSISSTKKKGVKIVFFCK